jgi:DNA repair protein RadA/Sms
LAFFIMKNLTEFVCQQCGYKSPQFMGKCPECGEWNSLVETSVDVGKSEAVVSRNFELFKLVDVRSQKMGRISTGFGEFDRVLGGGVVSGSIVLISGDPGIGKSTLLLQAAIKVAEAAKVSKGSKVTNDADGSSVLYVSGEESAQQVKIRADRIGKIPDALYILPETDVETVVAASEKLKPRLMIIDSVQTLTSSKLSGSAGSVGQLRECSQILQRHAKSTNTSIFIVGHVTKEGSIAGPKVLEHLVDAVLNLEGDEMHAFRILRSNKNRFGSTFEVGVFEMQDAGLVEVANPSQVFLAQRIATKAGSVVTSTIAGGRPILAEVQALVTPTIFGIPARRVTGLDFSRMQVVIASLGRAAKLALGNLDIYLNVAGGLKISEPAVDLAAALAVVSAVVEKPVKEGICAFGEVGLLGELRPVGNIKNRIAEAKRLGFSDFVTSDRFKTLEDAVSYAVHGG